MAETIPWERPAGGNDGWSGSLRDVVKRWHHMSPANQAELGVSLAVPIQLEGWPEPKWALNDRDLAELAGRLGLRDS